MPNRMACWFSAHVRPAPWEEGYPVPERLIPQANGWQMKQKQCPRCGEWLDYSVIPPPAGPGELQSKPLRVVS